MTLRTVFGHPFEQPSDGLRTAVLAHPLIPPRRPKPFEGGRTADAWAHGAWPTDCLSRASAVPTLL